MSFSYDIRANSLKNRLYIRMVGAMTDDEAKKVAATIIDEIKKLRPGFAVINDISGLKPAGEKASEYLRGAQEASVKRGSGRVIRIVGSQAITQLQWNRTLKETQGIAAETAATLEEAERILDGGTPK